MKTYDLIILMFLSSMGFCLSLGLAQLGKEIGNSLAHVTGFICAMFTGFLIIVFVICLLMFDQKEKVVSQEGDKESKKGWGRSYGY